MSTMLRSHDIATSARLIAEVSSLRVDPEMAASHLLTELVRVTGSMRAGMGRRLSTPGLGRVGWTPLVYAGEIDQKASPQIIQILKDPMMRFPDADYVLAQRVDEMTFAREDVPRFTLHGKTRELHESMIRLVSEGDHLKSMSRHLGDSSYVGWLWLARPTGDARFGTRCSAMVNLIMHEIGPWLWPKLRQPLNERAAACA